MISQSAPAVSASPTLSDRATFRDWLALATLMLPVLLASVDNTVLSFAVPQISKALEPSSTQLLWVVDVYPLVLAGLLVTMGSLADRFGRRRMLMIGALGFTLISGIGAFSPSIEWLIAARAGMGFFGAMLMPSTLSLLRNIFQNGAQRRLAVAIWAACFTSGAALGPIIGGILLQHFWWGSVFLMAVPILIPLLVFAPFLVKESKDPKPGPVDPLSIALSFGAMVPLAFSIKSIASEGLGFLEILSATVGALCLWMFIRRQLRRPAPMLDLSLFAIRSFSGAVLVNLMGAVALTGFIFFISQHLQLVLNLAPNEAAMVLIPGFVLCVVAGILAAPLSRRLKPRTIIVWGLALSIVGYTIIALSHELSITRVITAFIILGIGIGMAETLSNDLILSSAPRHKAGAASAISETAYEFGSVLSITALGSLLSVMYRTTVELPAALSASDQAAATATLGGASDVAQRNPGLASDIMTSATHAFDTGGFAVATVSAILVGVTIVIAIITLREKTTHVSEKVSL